MQPLNTRSVSDMQAVLMNPDAPSPAIHYYMIRGGSDKQNITVWEAGTVGGEYIKSFGHYHRTPFNETYIILQGEGYLLLQERVSDAAGNLIDDQIQSARAIHFKAGNRITIPPGSGHLVVNTGSTWLVTSDNSPVSIGDKNPAFPEHADYETFKKLHGAAYYVVEKDGKPTFVKNPNYKTVPEISIETAQ